jgi:hypothetical protein
MKQLQNCPQGHKCLLLKTKADRDCEICRSCHDGSPHEFAVYVAQHEGFSRILGFTDLPQLVLDTTIEKVSIFRLAGEKYYSREAFTFQPESDEVKQALFAQVKSW